jgi:hypothetical protein
MIDKSLPKRKPVIAGFERIRVQRFGNCGSVQMPNLSF